MFWNNPHTTISAFFPLLQKFLLQWSSSNGICLEELGIRKCKIPPYTVPSSPKNLSERTTCPCSGYQCPRKCNMKLTILVIFKCSFMALSTLLCKYHHYHLLNFLLCQWKSILNKHWLPISPIPSTHSWHHSTFCPYEFEYSRNLM